MSAKAAQEFIMALAANDAQANEMATAIGVAYGEALKTVGAKYGFDFTVKQLESQAKQDADLGVLTDTNMHPKWSAQLDAASGKKPIMIPCFPQIL